MSKPIMKTNTEQALSFLQDIAHTQNIEFW